MKIINKLREILVKISPELTIRLLYLYYFRKPINLKNPKTLDEKIQWMKLHLYPYTINPIYTQCADKFLVRDFVKTIGGEKFLNKIIGVYENPEDIDWDILPNQFVIKWNFGNGLNIICHDKSSLNKKETIERLKIWKKIKAWTKTAEPQYRFIPKKIIIEKYIDDGNGGAPIDYKIYCFHGVPKYLFVCIGRAEGKKPKFYFFDKNWNLARINPDSISAPADFTLPRPKHLETMFDFAQKLSTRFPFVRVDLYDTPDQIFFGELTFTPGGGFDTTRLLETQILMGNLLHLENIK